MKSEDRSTVKIHIAGRVTLFRLVEWESGAGLIAIDSEVRRIQKASVIVGYAAAGKIIRQVAK